MASNNLQSVIARTLLALPFLANGVTTFLLLDPMSNAGPALDAMKPVLDRAQALLGTNVLPEELYVKVVVFLAVTQGMGGFLVVMNHKFGGFLLLLYLLPVTLLAHQFWREDPNDLLAQYNVLLPFLKNIGLMGGVLYFMATSDGVPLKVKRKPHQE